MTQLSYDAGRLLGILDSIKAHKVDEVARLLRSGARLRLEEICQDLPPTRSFADRIASLYAADDVALVAEIKKARAC
ncbi:hypothetical protein NS365_21605 [Aureimonas ureilytica]|uniref:Uncharacterized protein n=1 Tax=Aureimonas ureilytica TaxID=401562 RepID=A0A175RID9_9HYPH|nr:hypothetical protein NS365_21605 [Aureimonas ureilytica]